MLEKPSVSGHERRRREANDLPKRKVPGHDREHDPERLKRDDAPARVRPDLLICEVARRGRGEVLAGPGALLDLGSGLDDRFAHLQRGEARVAVDPLPQEPGEGAHGDGALRDRTLAPGQKRVVRLGKGHLDLVRPKRVARRDHFLGRRIYRGDLAHRRCHMNRG